MFLRSLVMASGMAGCVIAGCTSTRTQHEKPKAQERTETRGTSGTSGKSAAHRHYGTSDSGTTGTAGTTGGKSSAQGTQGTSGAPESAAEKRTVETIAFDQGSPQLSEEAKGKIRTLIDSAKQDGGVREVKVAVWSDSESPVRARKDLPKEDRQLAETRGDNVKNFLKHDLDVRHVKVFNMAEGTNWLAELFHTEAAELEQIFSAQGYHGKVSPELGLIRDHGKPSHAVVVVEHEHKGMAH